MTYLENYEVLASTDLHELRDTLVRLTYRDEIDVIGKGHEIDASLRAVDLGGQSLMHITYGNVPTKTR